MYNSPISSENTTIISQKKDGNSSSSSTKSKIPTTRIKHRENSEDCSESSQLKILWIRTVYPRNSASWKKQDADQTLLPFPTPSSSSDLLSSKNYLDSTMNKYAQRPNNLSEMPDESKLLVAYTINHLNLQLYYNILPKI